MFQIEEYLAKKLWKGAYWVIIDKIANHRLIIMKFSLYHWLYIPNGLN